MSEQPHSKAAIGSDATLCLHSRYVRGCPSCVRRLLKHYGVLSEQPYTGNLVGLNCFRPDVFERTPRAR